MTRCLTQRFAATTALAALAASLALPALAQQQPTSAPAATPDSQTQPQHRMGQRPGADPRDGEQQRRAHMAKRMGELKQQLKLTPAQEPAWTSFTAAMQPGERKALLDHSNMDKLTTPERIDRMRALRSQRAAEADRRGEAAKVFYAALTPVQQKTFDAQALEARHQRLHRFHHGDNNQAPHSMHGGTRGGPMG
ncbi:MAG: Spy/CpxP family protein refolding chaperone, partial [Acidovorax sp.]